MHLDLSQIVMGTGHRAAVRYYGCCRCQRNHAEGLDPLYEAHLMSQSKHGVRERPPELVEQFRRLVEQDAG